MSPEGGPSPILPVPVEETLDDFHEQLGLDVHLWSVREDGTRARHLYPAGAPDEVRVSLPTDGSVLRTINPKQGPLLQMEVRPAPGVELDPLATILKGTIERALNSASEIRFVTREVSERSAEIDLLYTISDTLGSVLDIGDAAEAILRELCDGLGARRGSLWLRDYRRNLLRLAAAVGPQGVPDEKGQHLPDSVTLEVFEKGRARAGARADPASTDDDGSTPGISVPIRYSPPSGEARTVGVINLLGRRRGGVFAIGDEKLLSAIASQIGAALENNRLIQESLAQERMSHEMELAHHLQMKLLKSPEAFDQADVAARVVPAKQVGGDFFHLFKRPDDKVGVMIGDVSTHGFPAALIMALSMSAASIYALQSPDPSRVLRRIDDSLRDELETTEMFLSLCYVVIDPDAGDLEYSNAGHPHAFVLRGGCEAERLTATDPPLGIAGPDSYHSSRTTWAAGDLLLLFTDGLSDTLATDRPGSGEAAVLDAVTSRASASPADIVDALFGIAEGVTPSIPADDRTAVVLRT